jgi:hypothetical protein
MVFKKNSPSSFPKIKIILSLCNFKGHNIKKYIYFGKHGEVFILIKINGAIKNAIIAKVHFIPNLK